MYGYLTDNDVNDKHTDKCDDYKNVERHAAHTLVSWPNAKQRQMGHIIL